MIEVTFLLSLIAQVTMQNHTCSSDHECSHDSWNFKHKLALDKANFKLGRWDSHCKCVVACSWSLYCQFNV